MNVILDNTPARVAKQSYVAAASQDSSGTAKVGIQESNPFPEKPLVVARAAPVEHPKTAIPKVVSGKELLVVKKSDQKTQYEDLPDLLVKETPVPLKPDTSEETYAPAPSVAKPVEAAPPPVEDLVSVEPASGVRQDRIVYAEPVQGNPLTLKPGNIPEELKPVKVEEPSPVKVEEPKPVKIETPAPVKVEQVKPLEIEKPQPVNMEQPQPARLEAPVPVKVEETTPADMAKPVPVKTDEPVPVKSKEPGSARPEVAAGTSVGPGNAGDADISKPGSIAFRLPGLAELSIASARKFAGDNDRKIKFGERRKTVDAREQDFRYSMYVESVRLKLQRIGRFNFPAEAAMKNLSGTLSVIISIRADGSLEDFSILQPSAYEVLDRGAENIVRLSAPFSPFPDSIRKETDLLNIRVNWFFSKSSQTFD